MAISPKQQRFVDEYTIDQNATQAYKRAGYRVLSAKSAKSAGGRLYANPIVRAAIDAKLAILAEETGMTAKEAWRESRYIALSDIGDVIDFSGIEPRLKPANQIPESARRALKSVKVKRYMEGTGEEAREVQILEFTFWDKPAELHTRLKALGELKEKVEHTHKGGAPIQTTDTIIDSRATRAKIISFAEEFREAALRTLQEKAEHINGDGANTGTPDGATDGDDAAGGDHHADGV
jgi:phage terminase small subunit